LSFKNHLHPLAAKNILFHNLKLFEEQYMTITNNPLILSIRKKLLTHSFFFFIGLTSGVYGQNLSFSQAFMPSETDLSLRRNISIGLNIGIINGIGIDAAYTFADHWAVKLAYNYADYTKHNYTYDIVLSEKNGVRDVKTLSFDAAIRLSNVALNVEYTPHIDGRFKLIGGFSYFYDNTITLGGQSLSIFKYNDVSLTPEDIGSGSVEVGFNSKVAPFIGLGFGKTIPKKRVNVNFELGTYYKTPYKVAIHVQPGILLKRNEENADVLTRNFNKRWYGKFFPVLNLRIAVPISWAKY
jgi:hypothetical protein